MPTTIPPCTHMEDTMNILNYLEVTILQRRIKLYCARCNKTYTIKQESPILTQHGYA